MEEYRIKMVGMQFQKPSKVPEWGDTVRFVHEKDNAYDANAVAIINDSEERIGYVGTKNTVFEGNRRNGCIDNEELLSELDFDAKYVAFISKARDGFGFVNVVVGE